MTRFSEVAICQQCDESLSAYDIITTHQAKLCPDCLIRRQTLSDGIDVARSALAKPVNALKLSS